MRLISVGPVAYEYAERRRTTWVFCLCPPVRWSPQSPDCCGALVGGREMIDPLGRLSAKLRARASKVLSRWGALVHAIPFVLAAVVPVFVLSVLTRVLGVDLGYGAVAETLMFPIIVGAAWGGGLGAVLVSAVAIAFISPTAAHEFLGLQKSVPIVAVWVFQAILFASFAAISSALFSWVGSPSRRGSGRSPKTGEQFEGYERVLASLANTVEVRDHHTQGHCERVARNALVLGRELDLSTAELSVLYWAARLHDLGKIAVPEYILLKSGRLTEEEFSEIRRHPSYGADLLASVSTSFRPIADVVRAHHERWDGLGYPLGYKGDEIPRLARIIAIVDVFEALTSERPYRSPMPASHALRYITNGSQTQFDPDLVGVFERLYNRGKIECAGTPSLGVLQGLGVSDTAAYLRA